MSKYLITTLMISVIALLTTFLTMIVVNQSQSLPTQEAIAPEINELFEGFEEAQFSGTKSVSGSGAAYRWILLDPNGPTQLLRVCYTLYSGKMLGSEK